MIWNGVPSNDQISTLLAARVRVDTCDLMKQKRPSSCVSDWCILRKEKAMKALIISYFIIYLLDSCGGRFSWTRFDRPVLEKVGLPCDWLDGLGKEQEGEIIAEMHCFGAFVVRLVGRNLEYLKIIYVVMGNHYPFASFCLCHVNALITWRYLPLNPSGPQCCFRIRCNFSLEAWSWRD